MNIKDIPEDAISDLEEMIDVLINGREKMNEKKHKIVYPYTCPFFRSDNPVTKGFNFDDCENYITYDEFDILNQDYFPRYHVHHHCSLSREICGIMIDLDAEGVPTSTEELLKNFDYVSEYEMETIRANVDQFFKSLEVKHD